MRRIVVYRTEHTWHFSAPQFVNGVEHESALSAATAARDYGDTLRGQALGYIIRLQSDEQGRDFSVTLHTQVF